MRWISVAERLPDTVPDCYCPAHRYSEKDVPFWDTNGEWHRGRYFVVGKAYWGDPWGDGLVMDARRVTHWLDLEPPKEEE